MSPFEALFNTKLEGVWVFLLPLPLIILLSAYFWGHSHKGYKCLHPSSRIYIAKSVSLNEIDFPYSSLFQKSSISPLSFQH